MTTISILLICSVIIYLVWKYYEVQKKITEISETNNEFSGKVTKKFINIDKDVIELNTDIQSIKKKRSVKINTEVLDRINIIEAELSKTNQIVATFDNDILKISNKSYNIDYCIETYEKLQKELDKLFVYDDIFGYVVSTKKDYENYLNINQLKYEIDKLKKVIESPAFQSYQSFIAELENHKSKIRTSNGRVSLNKELIVNMIKDGKLSVDGVYSYSQLQTALMEFLQCKKNSTNSKIQRLTNKGLFKKIYSEMGTLYEVNI